MMSQNTTNYWPWSTCGPSEQTVVAVQPWAPTAQYMSPLGATTQVKKKLPGWVVPIIVIMTILLLGVVGYLGYLLFQGGSSSASSGGCPSDWQVAGSKCYLFVPTKANIDAALGECVGTHGADLISIKSAEENAAIKTAHDAIGLPVAGCNTYFTSGRRPPDTAAGTLAFKWGDGTLIDNTNAGATYANWEATYPKTESNRCVAVKVNNNYAWRNLGCGASSTECYICEKPIA